MQLLPVATIRSIPGEPSNSTESPLVAAIWPIPVEQSVRRLMTTSPRFLQPFKGLREKQIAWVLFMSLLGFIALMMPAGAPTMSSAKDFNYRIPPAWSPENEASYSFRAYFTDISLWIMLTGLAPHQQCAAIVMRLGGAAREMARMITPQEMVQGGSES